MLNDSPDASLNVSPRAHSLPCPTPSESHAEPAPAISTVWPPRSAAAILLMIAALLLEDEDLAHANALTVAAFAGAASTEFGFVALLKSVLDWNEDELDDAVADVHARKAAYEEMLDTPIAYSASIKAEAGAL